ncbi:MAG: hypothetical protein N2116_01775, partial [Armatimonadetes bacterium]|nr:hypothetical protein [Armatimonadota bacterium]
RYWALSLQWLASPNSLLALHWTQGYPPKWGVGGGWSEDRERARFLILEGRFFGLWSSGEEKPGKIELAETQPETATEGKFALLTFLRGNKGTISAGSRQGIKVGMKLTITDFATNKVVGYFTVTQVKRDEASGRVESLPNQIVQVGSKLLLLSKGQ